MAMSFEEKPDRIGRTFLIAIALWGGLGVVIYVVLSLAIPSHPSVATASAPPVCASTAPATPYLATIDDPAMRVLLAPAFCDPREGTGGDPIRVLHAYLDGARLSGAPTKPAPAVDASLHARGAELFDRHCANCHGATGDGAGPNTCALEPHAAALKNGVYTLRTTEHEALPTDEDIFRTITRGIHGTAMPPWFALAERDRWALVAHVKALSKQFEEDTAPRPFELGTAPAPTGERLTHGRTIYMSGGCASCHGAKGNGDGAAASSLPIQPRAFTRGHFHRGSSVAEIHMTLVTGLDGTPMGSFAKILHDDELWDVALYVHALAPPAIQCGEVNAGLHAQELFGVRNLMTTLNP
jgi:cytochrome c oxidase cbb3-type subunit 2